MTTDLIITQLDGKHYDISFTADGDVATSQSLDTAILMSILAEVRATASEMPESQRRRGWVGNESTQGIEMGSKAWLFEQARVTGSNLAELGVFINNALQWMIEQRIVVSTQVDAVYNSGTVLVNVTLFRASSVVERRLYELWNNTGNNL